MPSDRPVLICDGMNIYMRAFCAYPSMSVITGEQTGGIVGFLKILAHLCNDISPRLVIVAWEGGGSQKRRAIYSDYKMNRRPEKLNRFYEEDIPDTDENKQKQLVTLLELLKNVPIKQLYVQNAEGDDLIAYLCKSTYKNVNKVIASSDKDMYQLLDDTTRVYNLHKKTYVTSQSVFDEYKITARNFALAKTLCGDPSDNIPGVKGLGYKTLVKKLPFIGLEKDIILQDVFDYCHANVKASPVYKKVIESIDDIKRNWRLIYLDAHSLNNEQSSRVDRQLETFTPRVDRMRFMQILSREGIVNFDIASFYYSLNCVDRENND